jgi:hypothetical protein
LADDNDRLYVPLRCSGVPPLQALFDGLPFVIRGRRVYLRIEDAIVWHLEEGNTHNAEVLQEVLRRHRTGEGVEYR